MTDTEMPAFSNPGVYQRIEERLNRIEDKLDTRMTALDSKVDGIKTRQDSLEGELRGAFGMLKWLGPTGVAALAYALVKSAGFI